MQISTFESPMEAWLDALVWAANKRSGTRPSHLWSHVWPSVPCRQCWVLSYDVLLAPQPSCAVVLLCEELPCMRKRCPQPIRLPRTKLQFLRISTTLCVKALSPAHKYCLVCKSAAHSPDVCCVHVCRVQAAESVLGSIENRIQHSAQAAEQYQKEREEVEAKAAATKALLKVSRGLDAVAYH